LKLCGLWYCRKHKSQGSLKPNKIPAAELRRLKALSPKKERDQNEIISVFHAVLDELLALRGIKKE